MTTATTTLLPAQRGVPRGPGGGVLLLVFRAPRHDPGAADAGGDAAVPLSTTRHPSVLTALSALAAAGLPAGDGDRRAVLLEEDAAAPGGAGGHPAVAGGVPAELLEQVPAGAVLLPPGAALVAGPMLSPDADLFALCPHRCPPGQRYYVLRPSTGAGPRRRTGALEWARRAVVGAPALPGAPGPGARVVCVRGSGPAAEAWAADVALQEHARGAVVLRVRCRPGAGQLSTVTALLDAADGWAPAADGPHPFGDPGGDGLDEVVRRLTRCGPAVLVLHDARHLDGWSLAVLERLLRRHDGLRLLLHLPGAAAAGRLAGRLAAAVGRAQVAEVVAGPHA
ncbi:hypothetical protein MO973_40900 [Paenibacillus sp. TRM 82003]|uniref:hypothetical protein n=1 Tax=Kineococcus sp. TRM81007 TaxID=2925831 RepID=UPI001F569DB6|nr:hypothetical protein [Kineococcus sp. TRM81007]MCI2237337.1 hypothetical protein [Kineococcus sp. TRM81007]MCI3926556.1 hypothetical protein [Paenibacillus sp. TRM 82003]